MTVADCLLFETGISFAVHRGQPTSACGTKMRLATAKRILQYLTRMNDDDVYIRNKRVSLQGSSDDGYAGGRKDRKSVSGGVLCINRMIVGWICKKQASVDLSTMEAEFVAAYE